MNTLNKRIAGIPLPDFMRNLPISDEGHPIPYFVGWVNGKPDFRSFDGNKLKACVNKNLCWLCGQPMYKNKTFVIGPMCAVNRTSAEPPSHHQCAEYAVKACPFLTQPRMRRNEKDLPENRGVAGTMIERNPGVTLLWTTQTYMVFRAGPGVLFQIGDPKHIECYAEGRTATQDEILESIRTGLPILHAEALKDGPESVALLDQMLLTALEILHLPPMATPSAARTVA